MLSEILNNTLDVSKLEEGKIEFNNNYESIMSVIDMVVGITKTNADRKGIKILSNYGPKLPPLLEFDKSRLTQIIMNLVGNAIKFTPEKGKVTIGVNWTPRRPIRKFTGMVGQQSCQSLDRLVSSPEEAKVSRKKSEAAIKVSRSAETAKLNPKEHSSTPLRADREEGLLERVPDEMSPDSSASPRKILGNISTHKLIAHSNERFQSLYRCHTSRPSLIERGQGSLSNWEARFPSGEPESRSMNGSALQKKTRSPKSFTDSAASPHAAVLTDGSQHEAEPAPGPAHNIETRDRLTEESRKSNSRCTLPWAFDGTCIIKLKKVAKEFRLSSKELPTLGKNNRSPLAVGKASSRLSSLRKHLERTRSLFTIPSGADLSPKLSDSCCDAVRKGTLTIKVTDTGCGMSEEEMHKLFQPFAQANKGIHAKFGGTGLGLWLSHKLIAAMDGKITCSSEVEKGTTFTISLQVNYRPRPDDSSVP